MKRLFLRGSSSQGSKDKQAKEKEKVKYNLPCVAEVRPCEWPCDEFLTAAGIHDDFYSLVENAGLTDFLATSANNISYSLIFSCKIFISMLGDHHLQWNFIYMMSIRRCPFLISVGSVRYPLRAA